MKFLLLLLWLVSIVACTPKEEPKVADEPGETEAAENLAPVIKLESGNTSFNLIEQTYLELDASPSSDDTTEKLTFNWKLLSEDFDGLVELPEKLDEAVIALRGSAIGTSKKAVLELTVSDGELSSSLKVNLQFEPFFELEQKIDVSRFLPDVVSFKMQLVGEDEVIVAGEFAATLDFDLSSADLSKTSVGNNDVFVASYNLQTHRPNWVKTFGSTGNESMKDFARRSSDGTIFVGGGFATTMNFDTDGGTATYGTGGYNGGYLSKFASDGSYQYTRIVAEGGSDFVNAIGIASDGSVYASGDVKGNAHDFDWGAGDDTQPNYGHTDAFLFKINSDDSYAWAKTFGGAGYDVSRSLTTDAYGGVLVGLITNSTPFNFPDASTDTPNAASYGAFFVKFDGNGNIIYKKQPTTNDWSHSDAVGTNGNNSDYVLDYVAKGSGYLGDSSTYPFDSSEADVVLSKYNSSGGIEWGLRIFSEKSDSAKAHFREKDGVERLTAIITLHEPTDSLKYQLKDKTYDISPADGRDFDYAFVDIDTETGKVLDVVHLGSDGGEVTSFLKNSEATYFYLSTTEDIPTQSIRDLSIENGSKYVYEYKK